MILANTFYTKYIKKTNEEELATFVYTGMQTYNLYFHFDPVKRKHARHILNFDYPKLGKIPR